jgi:hypothetical protein
MAISHGLTAARPFAATRMSALWVAVATVLPGGHNQMQKETERARINASEA